MENYSILAINPGHNGSAALVINGQVVFYAEEERYSRMKYDGNPYRAMLQVLVSQPVNELVIGGTNPNLPTLPWTGEDPYTALARKFNPGLKVTNMGNLHHLGHAAAGFYASGFETAAAVVVDGAGSMHQEDMGEGLGQVAGYETETIYQCSYPHEFNAVYKRYSSGQGPYWDNGIQEFEGSVTITKAYEAVSHYLGFGFIEAGKTMGLAPYGTKDDNIPPFFVGGKGNRNLLLPAYPAGALIDEHRFPYLRRFNDPAEWHKDFTLVRDVDKNLAWHVQAETEQMMFALIQKAVDLTGETNIVLSGGYGLNCVANYKYLKKFPDLKFWIDPIAHDGGTALGLARYVWHKHSESVDANPLKTVYMGIPPDYNQLSKIQEQVGDNLTVEDVDADKIADLLDAGNIIALFQGQAEGGPRALGNRSILFDPRVEDGKDRVNVVKQREWFRPFAGVVLEDQAGEWFDMAGLESSPYMMYAVDVLEAKASTIPAVTHIDRTCRVQTVNSNQNKHLHSLLVSWYAKTGVPILLNTSFNLAGQPLVENLVDAAVTLLNSQIDWLWLPDIGKLVGKK